MAIKHFEDGGDVNVAVFDNGQVLWVCAQCQKSWLGAVTPASKAEPSTLTDLANALRGNAAFAGEFDVDAIVSALSSQ
jgi:hypothetical protein